MLIMVGRCDLCERLIAVSGERGRADFLKRPFRGYPERPFCGVHHWLSGTKNFDYRLAMSAGLRYNVKIMQGLGLAQEEQVSYKRDVHRMTGHIGQRGMLQT